MIVFFMILQNPMSGKNLVLQWRPKMLSDNALEGINLYIWFFAWRQSSKKGSFGWVWPVLSLVQLDFRNFWSSVCLEKIQQFIDFCREIVSNGRQHPGQALLGGCGQLCLLSSQIVGFFDHQYLWNESSDILVFCMELVIKGMQHLRLTIFSVVSCASHSIRLQEYLIISISTMSQPIYLIFCMKIIIKGTI